MNNCLLLEDHSETRKWIKLLLEELFDGIKVTEVATVKDATSKINEYVYDLILLDINLPDGSGLDVLALAVKKQSNAYCVMITILDEDENVIKAIELGAQGYLLKDQARDTIKQHLNGVILGQPPLSASISRKILRLMKSGLLNLSNTEDKSVNSQEELGLTDREIEVLTLLGKGFSKPEIGKYLGIATSTTAGYVRNIYQKLRISSTAEAAGEAIKHGLFKP